MIQTAEEFIQYKTEQFKKGLLIKVKDITRQGFHYWQREAWTFMPQSNYESKVFIIERLKRVKSDIESAKIGDIEYRIGYYIVGKIGRANGKWTWGQFCPLIPQEDFAKLFDKAKKEGTIK